MFPLGHLGITLGIAIALVKVRPTLERRLDLRFVLFGAILPDVIDKLFGHVILAGTLDNGRLVGHSALFAIVFLAVGILIASDRLTSIGFASGVHLGLDLMWYLPSTLFWPAYGFGFPAEDFEVYDWFATLVRDPVVQAGEVIGGIILLWFVLRHGLYRIDRIREFLFRGVLVRQRPRPRTRSRSA